MSDDDLNPTHDLQRAIEKLEKFAEQNEAETVPLVVSMDPKSTSLDRTIDLAKSFISSQFSEKTRIEQEKKRDLAQQEMLHAVAVVKRNYLLIQKLNRGTADQQALAESAMQAVERYNAILAKTKQPPPTWSSRISRYVYEKCALTLGVNIQPIHIPQNASFRKSYSPKKISKNFDSSQTAASSRKIASFIEDKSIQSEPILKHEEEAFRVKAISLLRNHGIRFTSASEEFSAIRSTPIQAIQQDQRRILTQILKPFPGEVIEFKGEFEPDASLRKSIPVSHSFEVSTKSEQTGFPHPSQHNGWALSDLLIPPCPHHFDLLPKFQQLYAQKQSLALELLPEGKLIAQARENLKIKKQIFDANAPVLLEKHQNLNLAMLNAQRDDGVTKNEKAIISNYYQHLKDSKCAYEYHCQVQEIILLHFVGRPYEKIQEEWLHEKKIWDIDVKLRHQAISKMFNEEFNRSLNELRIQKKPFQHALDYIALMGSALGTAASTIILQHLSENLSFPPPMLSDFEMKMQTALYKQVIDFHGELTRKNFSVENMLAQLEGDIAIFESESFDDLEIPAADIVKELEVYSNSRFFNT